MHAPVIDIISFPYDDTHNPYFELWRNALLATGRATVSPPPRYGLLALACSSAPKDRLIVIHWSTKLYGSRYVVKSLLSFVGNFMLLAICAFRGSTVFWVMHNRGAHDYPHPRIDRAGRRLMRSLADAVIVHQESVRKEMAAMHPHKRFAYIPHGNYIGFYGPRPPDRARTRASYGFGADDVVFLSLGMIRPYKKNEFLISAFMEACGSLPRSVKLWIVGKGDSGYVQSLRERAGKHAERIRIENRFVPNEELPTVLAASDYGVFRYDESELTSGAVVLALSYGVPIVSPRVPGAEMAEEGVSVFYYETQSDLSAAYVACARRVPASVDRVRAAVAGHSWKQVAESYVRLYDECHE